MKTREVRSWMKPETVAPIMAALALHPAGATAKQIAAEIGLTPVVASQRLGRLSFQGRVERRPAPNRENNLFLYFPKAEANA